MPPRPCATKELPWRQYIAQVCAEAPAFSPEPISAATSFEVTLVFFLSDVRCRDTDLDNLVKPVLDTVFLIERPQTENLKLTGALIKRNDNAIRKLTLEKRVAPHPEDVGVDILIEW